MWSKETKFIVKEWASSSSIHAISNVGSTSSSLAKLLWGLCFGASLVYCGYTLINLLITYASFSVLINMTVVNKVPIDFPAVTVCNLNPFDRRYAASFINNVLQQNNLSYVRNLSNVTMGVLPSEISNLIKAAIAAEIQAGNTTIAALFGFDLNYMLLSCSFMDRPCNVSDFVMFYNYQYTTCFTFNSGQNGSLIRQISESGSDKSFRLELFLGEEFLQGEFNYNSGAHVIIHNQSITPIVHSEGKDISSNYQTNIGISRRMLKRLGPPYSDCIANTRSIKAYDSTFYRAMFTRLNMSEYRQKNCLDLCQQEYIIGVCKCIDASLPNIYGNELDICLNRSGIGCVVSARMSYYTNGTHNSCSQCPLECDSFEYDYFYSTSRYPTTYYTNYLRYRTNVVSKFSTLANSNDNGIQKNIVLLNVFYDDTVTTYVEEKAQITSDSLLGNIGGNLGLFVGASFLSFIEIIELIVMLGAKWLKSDLNE